MNSNEEQFRNWTQDVLRKLCGKYKLTFNGQRWPFDSSPALPDTIAEAIKMAYELGKYESRKVN